MVPHVPQELDVREPELPRDVVREVPAAPVVGLPYHHPCARLPRLLKEAEAPALLLLLHEPAEEVVELVAQAWPPALVYAEQLLLLRHRAKPAAHHPRQRVERV